MKISSAALHALCIWQQRPPYPIPPNRPGRSAQWLQQHMRRQLYCWSCEPGPYNELKRKRLMKIIGRICDMNSTHSSQSMVKSKDISSRGQSMACSTTCRSMSEPLGILMPDIEVNVVVKKIVNNWPALNTIPLILVMKITAIDINAAVPSVLTLVPMGNTKRTILESMPNSFSVTRNDTGRVAALQT